MSKQDDMNKFKQVLTKLPEDKRKLLYERLHELPASEREDFIKDFLKKYDAKQCSFENKKHLPEKNAPQQVKKKPATDSSSKSTSNEDHPSPSTTSAAKAAPAAAKSSADKAAPAAAKSKPDSNGSSKERTSKKALSSADKHVVTAKKQTSTENAVVAKRSSAAPDKPVRSRVISKKKPAAKVNPYTSAALGILIALVILATFYFVYLFNKTSVDAKFDAMLGLDPTESYDISQEPVSIMGPAPNFPTATPTVTPIPTAIPIKEDAPDLTGLVIVIDPGHQATPDTELESIASNSSIEKEKATSGATGISSGAKEYEITLRYASVMKQYLEACGATVILTRADNETSISNSERAKIAVDNNADYFIRLHADNAPDPDIRGVKVYVPSSGNYTSSSESEGKRLAETVAESIGSTSLGVIKGNMYTGLNYADSIESYQLVIGYISNSDDDALLASDETAYNTAVGVAEFLRQ